jgi:two-component sensor histidine kinase
MKNIVLVFVVLIFCSSNGFSQIENSTAKINHLKYSYYNAGDDTIKLRTLKALTQGYYDLSDFKNTLLYNKQLKLLAEKLKSSTDAKRRIQGVSAEAYYYSFLGDVFQKQSNFLQANDFYFHSLNLFKAVNDQYRVGVMLSNIASTFSGLGNYKESLSYSFKALDLNEKLKHKRGMAIELNNIGAIYSDIGNHTKSHEYHVKAKEISEEIKDDGSTAVFTGNIAHYYKYLCDSSFDAGNLNLSLKFQDTAFQYFIKAIELSEKVSDIDNIAVCLENIGILYANIENYKEALPYLLRAHELYVDLDLNAEQSFCLTLIGEAYQTMGEAAKAEEFFIQALEIAKKTNSFYFLMHANSGISDFYKKSGQSAKALMYYKDFVSYRDSMFNKENSMALTRTEMNYEFEKKQAAQKFEHDKVVYQLAAENKLQKQWRWFFIVVIVLACAGIFFMKRAYDSKKRLALFLESEDQRKDTLLQEVHHRINNNLQIISSLLTLQANSANDEKLSEYLSQSQNRIQSLSALHELLYDTNSPLEINMKDYIEKVLDFHRDVLRIKSEEIFIITEIEQVNFPTKLAVPLALIINELVTNSIKYAFKNCKGGQINVQLMPETGNNWQIRISDNGHGLPLEAERRKESLGLKLVNIMTKQIKGTITSKNENGAVFNIIFSVIKQK